MAQETRTVHIIARVTGEAYLTHCGEMVNRRGPQVENQERWVCGEFERNIYRKELHGECETAFQRHIIREWRKYTREDLQEPGRERRVPRAWEFTRWSQEIPMMSHPREHRN